MCKIMVGKKGRCRRKKEQRPSSLSGGLIQLQRYQFPLKQPISIHILNCLFSRLSFYKVIVKNKHSLLKKEQQRERKGERERKRRQTEDNTHTEGNRKRRIQEAFNTAEGKTMS